MVISRAEVGHPRIVVDTVARPGEPGVIRVGLEYGVCEGGLDFRLRSGGVHVCQPHSQPSAERVGEAAPRQSITPIERVRCAELRRAGGCRGHGRRGLSQIREQTGVDILLRIVLGRGHPAVSAQGLGIGHVAPNIGDVAEHQAAQHGSRTPQQRLVSRPADVDHRLEVLQLLGVRVDEVPVRVTGAEPPIRVLIGVLDFREVLHGEFRPAQIHGAGAEPARHRQACGVGEHRPRRSGGGIVGILIDVRQVVTVAGTRPQREERHDSCEAKHFACHGTIRRLNPMLRGFDGIMYSRP